jgi:hypothetical protein
MFIQWCIKGVNGLTDDQARGVIDENWGLPCRWWQNQPLISPPEIRAKLTRRNLDMHVNQYQAPDPSTGRPFCEGTPFISLSAGCVERRKFLRTNTAHRARMIALDFATKGGSVEGYLYTCYVLVALNPAVGVEGLAEEVRELNTYRRYSPWQVEGELTAKVIIPTNQILRCEKWSFTRMRFRRAPQCHWVHDNPAFDHPRDITNIRELI